MKLVARGLERRFGARTLFEGVDLQIPPGGCVRLAGPSGSGKTQLLRGLAWLGPFDGGEVTLEGRSPTAWGVPAWRARVAYVPQKPPGLPGTPLDLVELVARFAAQASRPGDDPVGVGARWGLPAEAWARPWSELSGGEQQRAYLAVAVSRRPDVLLLDEPTSALDAEATAAVERDLQDWAVCWVTHDAAQAARVGGDEVRLG